MKNDYLDDVALEYDTDRRIIEFITEMLNII